MGILYTGVHLGVDGGGGMGVVVGYYIDYKR